MDGNIFNSFISFYFLIALTCLLTISTGISVPKFAALILSIFAQWFAVVHSAVVFIDVRLYVTPVTAIVVIKFLSTN